MSNVSDIICQAIERRLLLSVAYAGSTRTVEPYILGHDRAGTMILSAVQVKGGSGGGFRSFVVDKLRMVALTDRHFDGTHPAYRADDPYFERVIRQVPQIGR